MASPDYPRDMIGYGRTPPDPRWPQGGRIAVQFVINYEEGSENNILHGDPASEAFMSAASGIVPMPGTNMAVAQASGGSTGFSPSGACR